MSTWQPKKGQELIGKQQNPDKEGKPEKTAKRARSSHLDRAVLRTENTASGWHNLTYQREKDLPTLLALWPSELCDYSPKGTAALIVKLEQALNQERRRARKRHWSYNLARHLALIKALRQEQNRLACLPSSLPPHLKIGSKRKISPEEPIV